MTRARTVAGALALGIVLLAGCTDQPTGGAVDGPVLTTPPGPGDVGMDAQVRGTVDLRDGCLMLVTPDGPVYPVLWPAGTTWQEDPAAVLLDGGAVVELGTAVSGGGGYLQVDAIEQVAGTEVADTAAACTGPTGEIAMFNVGSTVDVDPEQPAG